MHIQLSAKCRGRKAVDRRSEDGTAEAAKQELSLFGKQFAVKSEIQNSSPAERRTCGCEKLWVAFANNLKI
jgi:hypothetical protein